MMKFCANLSFMFTESCFLERYQLAKNAGFKAVESGFPFGLTQHDVVEAKNGANIEQILINTFTGDVTKGELGFAAIPGMQDKFKDSFDTTLSYAKALNVKKIHIMSGKTETVTDSNHQVYEENLRYATKMLEKENIIGLIEPINHYSVPYYYLNCYDRALNVVKNINSPNLKIMLDVFHLQHIRGNITNNIKDLIEYVGHVQIAQVPNRHEPNYSGEINYVYVLQTLKDAGYNDWIGLEYKPVEDTVGGLKWIEALGFTL